MDATIDKEQLIKAKLPDSRWTAGLLHFGLSLGIFIVLLLLIVLWWYPGALFPLAGGWQGIKIVAGVDLVLGPLLTLIIYNKHSKPLRKLYRDLSIILLIQLSCLAGGVYIVFKERPVAVVYAYDKFYTLKIKDLRNSENADMTVLGNIYLSKPKLFYVQLPTDPGQLESILALHGFIGDALELRTDLYQPFPTSTAEAKTIMIHNPLLSAETDTCLKVKLATAFIEQPVCFDAQRQGFVNQFPDQSTQP